VLAEAVSPAWIFVKHRPLVERVLVASIDGLSERVLREEGEHLPFVRRLCAGLAGNPCPLRLPYSMFSSCSVLQALASCPKSRTMTKKERRAEDARKAKVSHVAAAAAASVAAAAAAAAAKPAGKSESKGEEEDDEEVDGADDEDALPPASYYLASEVELAQNEYPMEGEETRPGADGREALIAIDCEMCTTKAGLELARLTLVAQDRSVLYDELVMPANPIVDYNTRFSGITAEMMRGVTRSVNEAREAFLRLVPREAIVVGHSVENDLRSVGVVHRRVIDTALLYPHPRGPPLKNSLRFLAKRFLGREIQDKASGHCSHEDALAALELVELKLAKGPLFGIEAADSESLFQVLARYRRRCTMVAAPFFLKAVATPAVSVVPCDSDEQVARQGARLIAAKDKPSDLVWLHLRSPILALEAQAGAVSAEDGEGAPARQRLAARDVPSTLRATDALLESVWAAAPPNTLCIFVSAQAFHADAARLQRQKMDAIKSGKGEAAFGEVQEQRLHDALQELQHGFAVLWMKQRDK
jgi:RNA exonuclease 1